MFKGFNTIKGLGSFALLSLLSACNGTSIRKTFVDRVGPTDPTMLTWMQTSPHNLVTATASWTVSTSADLENQKIQFFSDGVCSATGTLIDLSSSTTSTQSLPAGADGITYSFEIISNDTKGNITTSPCSTPMMIDTTPPAIAITSAPTWINTVNVAAYPVVVTCSDATSLIAGNVTVTVTDNAAHTASATGACGTTISPNTSGLNSGNGIISVYAQVSDNATNSTTTATLTESKDITLPTISIGATSVTLINSTMTTHYTVTFADTNVLSSYPLAATVLGGITFGGTSSGGCGATVTACSNSGASPFTCDVAVTGCSGHGTADIIVGTTAYADVAGNNKATVTTSGTTCVGSFSGGAGSVGSPFQIANRTDLQNIDNACLLSRYYNQIADIDLGGVGTPFTPIGAFSGHYDGNQGITCASGTHCYINNLYYHGALSQVGLFSQLSSTGVLNGIAMVNVDLLSTASPSSYIGGIVGYNNGGTISNSRVTGNLSGVGHTSNGSGGIGGIVGAIAASGLVSYSSAIVILNATSFAGGIVGQIFSGSVQDSYSVGTISASNMFAGGISGHLPAGSTISDSWSTANVSGATSRAGGISGYSNGTIIHTYVGNNTVSSAAMKSAIVGGEFSSTNTQNYYQNSIGLPNNSGVGTGLTTAQLGVSANFTGFDLGGVGHHWTMTTSGNWRITSDAPALTWQCTDWFDPIPCM